MIRASEGGECGLQFRSPGICARPGIVFTDELFPVWNPGAQAFMVQHVSLEDEAVESGESQTCYSAHTLHWNATGNDKHLQMEFYVGWNAVSDPLLAMAKCLWKFDTSSRMRGLLAYLFASYLLAHFWLPKPI
jgi:hypothetical protein